MINIVGLNWYANAKLMYLSLDFYEYMCVMYIGIFIFLFSIITNL
jgi:hypothetical protein